MHSRAGSAKSWFPRAIAAIGRTARAGCCSRLRVAVVLVVIGTSLFALHAKPAKADACGPGDNPVVCENSLPGTPRSAWDVNSQDGATIQGFADPFSVNLGGTINFKIQIARFELRDRYLSNGILRRRWRAADHQLDAEHRSLAEPACLCHQHRDRSCGLLRLGRLGELDGAHRLGLRCLLRAHLPDRRHQRLESDPVRGPRRCEPLRHLVQDRRRDLGGLQHVGRLQPLRRERDRHH